MPTNNSETVTFISMQGPGAIQQALTNLPMLQQGGGSLGLTGGGVSSGAGIAALPKTTRSTRGGSREQHKLAGQASGRTRRKNAQAEGTGAVS